MKSPGQFSSVETDSGPEYDILYVCDAGGCSFRISLHYGRLSFLSEQRYKSHRSAVRAARKVSCKERRSN